jgi:hypothetical protein
MACLGQLLLFRWARICAQHLVELVGRRALVLVLLAVLWVCCVAILIKYVNNTLQRYEGENGLG